MDLLSTGWRVSEASETLFSHVYGSSRYIYIYIRLFLMHAECFANEIQELGNGRLSILSGKVPVEVAVEVASSRLLFASFSYSSFFSKRVLDYANSQHGTNQYWFIINKKIPLFLFGELARLVKGIIY